MNVAVLGGTGRVGRLVVDELIAQGHHVTVLVHRSGALQSSDQLTVVQGDVHDGHAIESVLQGNEVLISTLGSWGTKQKDILSAALTLAVPLMEQRGISRLISLTGSGALLPNEQLSVAGRLGHRLFGIVAGAIIRDAEVHLLTLQQSSLQWTVVRSPIMRTGTNRRYVLRQQAAPLWKTVTRAAVAQALIDQLTDDRYYRQAPHIVTA